MRSSRLVRLLLLLAGISATQETWPQQTFDLDPSFRTNIGQQYVSSLLPLDDGSVIASGVMRFAGELSDKRLVKLLQNGTRDESFYNSGLGQGKLVKWADGLFYVATSSTVRRILPNGYQDPAFISMNLGPYFSSLQGGDYHVFEDGRVVLGGRHILSDTIRGFVGPHCLTWFNNQGYLDTTRTHRPCNGVLTTMKELPNGQFIGSGGMSIWDGQPTSRIFRFNADGSLDPGFQANITWGQAYGFLPLPDGRVYAAGAFGIGSSPDTLRFVRFLPDGGLDPAFNNVLSFEKGTLTSVFGGLPSFIHQLDANALIVTGAFHSVAGQPRKGICVFDTTGTLLETPIGAGGAGTYDYQNTTLGTVRGIVPTQNGQYFIWGSFHGYDDGTTNDTLQRMVSRLHGFNVGVNESDAVPRAILSLHPNPASSWVAIDYDLLGEPVDAAIAILDLAGREVKRLKLIEPRLQVVLDTRELSSGSYTVVLNNSGHQRHVEKLVIRQ